MQTEFYKKYMRSKEWEQKRQQRLEIDNHKCAMCDRPESKCKDGLQMHHITYERLEDENVLTDLVSLCSACHVKIHKYYGRRRTA